MKQVLPEKIDTVSLDKVLKKFKGKAGALLGILEEAQRLNKNNCLSQEVLEYISDKTGVTLSKIYSVATFYTFFNLKPQGEHSIVVCRGTACHTRRSKNLLEYLKNILNLKEDESQDSEKLFLTTKDNKFTLKTVACFGQCALAPVAEIDGNIYSHMTEDKLRKIIGKIGRGDRRK